MSTEDQNIDEMESLFEGMVLFTPPQMVDNNSHNAAGGASLSRSLSVSSPPSSEPLDENLFSDLTVITPSHIEAVMTSSSVIKTERDVAAVPPSMFRQSSRKKKRAGLRIGYGRDSQLLDDPESSSAATPTIETNMDAEGEEKDEAFRVSSVSSESEHVDYGPTLHEHECGDASLKDTVESYSNDMNIDGSLSLTEDRSLKGEELYASHKQEKEEKEAGCDDSLEGKYERIKGQVCEKLRKALEEASSISAAKKDARRKRRKAAENVELASIRYKEIEKKLEEACEAEDFEMAERLSESLAAAEKEKEHSLNSLRDADAECDAVDSKMQEALDRQIAAEEECASLLKHFSSDALCSADLVMENVEVTSSKEMDEWFMSVETVEAEKWILEIESQLVNDARSGLNDSIDQLAESDVKEKEILCERKKVLTQELMKLLSLVREKEAEIAENDSKIEAVDKKIAEVASGFKDVQSGINAKFDKLQLLLSEMETKHEALSKKKERIDNLLSQGENRAKELRKLATAAAHEANMYQENLGLRKALMTSVLKAREEKLRLGRAEEKVLADVRMIKQEISVARASLQELSSKKSTIQQENVALKQRMHFIDKRVPELEAEKKVAAAARNFKEAARIASEAKALAAEKEKQQIEIESSMLELGKIEDEINETTCKLQEFEELVSSKEKEAAVARFQRLCLISAAASSERSAALELGDLEEAEILLAEAEAADSEAKQLQSEHDISEEEEFGSLSKLFIPMELLSSFDGKQLEVFAAGCNQTPL